MKKNKLKRISSMISFGGLLFLSNISLISIGFASWTIGGAISADAEIKVTVEDLVDLNSYFDFQGETSLFSYCSDGIIEDQTIVNHGNLCIPFQINVLDRTTLKEHWKEEWPFIISTTLVDSNKSLDFFSSCDITSAKVYLSNSSLVDSKTSSLESLDCVQYSGSITGANKELKLLFNFSNNAKIDAYLSGSYLSFYVVYSVSFPKTGTENFNFKTNIYDNLGSLHRFYFSYKVGMEIPV